MQQIRLTLLIQRRKKYVRGGALISALFITAITAIIATALAVRGRLIINEGLVVKSSDQSYLNLQSVQDWARDQIERYVSQWYDLGGKAPATLRPMEWKFKKVRMGQSDVSADILDAQGRFNLNDLVYSANQPRFATLLMTVMQSVSKKQAYQIAQAITDWMTKGRLDTVYLQHRPAYRAPCHPMADVSELRLVNGVSAEIYNKLKPYIIVLPIKVVSTKNNDTQQQSSQQKKIQLQTKIDINSADWPVLMTAVANLTPEQAQSLYACRKRYGYFTSINAYSQACASEAKVKGGLSDTTMTTHSQFYLLNSYSQKGDLIIHLNSLLVSTVDKHNKLKTHIAWQAFY